MHEPAQQAKGKNTYVEINQPRSQGNKPLAFSLTLSRSIKRRNKTKQNEINKQTNLSILINNACAYVIKHFFEFLNSVTETWLTGVKRLTLEKAVENILKIRLSFSPFKV